MSCYGLLQSSGQCGGPPAEGGALGEGPAYEILHAVLLLDLLPAQPAAAVRPAAAVHALQRFLILRHLSECIDMRVLCRCTSGQL